MSIALILGIVTVLVIWWSFPSTSRRAKSSEATKASGPRWKPEAPLWVYIFTAFVYWPSIWFFGGAPDWALGAALPLWRGFESVFGFTFDPGADLSMFADIRDVLSHSLRQIARGSLALGGWVACAVLLARLVLPREAD